MSQPAPTPPPPRKPRRGLLIAWFILICVVGLMVFFYARGHWAGTTPLDPTTPEQGPLTQLLRLPDGHVTVRSAIVLPYPREKVWAAVTDYARYPDFLPYVKDMTAERGEGGTVVSGEAQAIIGGYWKFTMTVKERRDGDWAARWDEPPSGQILVNRGGWTARELGEGRTLLALDLETEAKGNPRFVMRNFYLYRLGRVMEAVRARLDSPPGE